jgi:hypothetical protein
MNRENENNIDEIEIIKSDLKFYNNMIINILNEQINIIKKVSDVELKNMELKKDYYFLNNKFYILDKENQKLKNKIEYLENKNNREFFFDNISFNSINKEDNEESEDNDGDNGDNEDIEDIPLHTNTKISKNKSLNSYSKIYNSKIHPSKNFPRSDISKTPNKSDDLSEKNINNKIIIKPFENKKNPLNLLFDSILINIMKEKEKKDNTDENIIMEEIDENIIIEELDIKINDLDDLINLGDLYYKLKTQPINNINKKEDTEKNIDANKEIKIDISDNIIYQEFLVDTSKTPNKFGFSSEKEGKQKNGLYKLNGKYYSIDLEVLSKLQIPLLKLRSMIGLKDLKNSIIDMILFYLQNFDLTHNNMLHTVIEGPPGVGKTEVGKIIAEIYACLGVIKTNKFKLVRRSDLIGEYLGHTAIKTQKVIDEADGGVLFIDEAYSLGSGSGDNKDSFSKECIDTLNQNLSENKKKLICIIAGYPDELEKCFFSVNPGLNRRFPFRYKINGYNENELKDIFIKKIYDIGWNIDIDFSNKEMIEIFKNNLNNFSNYGGDIENFITVCKFSHSRRVIGLNPKLRKKLNKIDIMNGLTKFIEYKNKKNNQDVLKSMFI